MREWVHRLGVILICLFFILLTIESAKKESLTFDEIFYLQEGTTNVTNRTFPLDPYNPPLIRELSVIPSVLGFTPSQGVPNEVSFLNRVIIITLAVILLWQVMATAYEYFGFWSSLLSGVLLAIEPTFLANSHYITPDIGVTLFTFLAYKAFLNILISPTLTRYFFFGIFLGLACASKISAVPFLAVSFIIIFLMKRKTFPMEWHMDHIGSAFFSIVTALFVIWGTYFFRMAPVIVPHENPDRVSSKLIAVAREKHIPVLAEAIQFFQGTPIPLGDYIGILKNNSIRSQAEQQVFFNGYFQPLAWYMVLEILFIKLPIPFLLLISIGIFLLMAPESVVKYLLTVEEKWKRSIEERTRLDETEARIQDEYNAVPRYKIRVKYEERMDKEWNYLFIIPVLSIILVACITRMTPLIRYLLPVYPFLALIGGSAVQSLRSNWKRIVLIVLLCWYAFTSLKTAPHFITFANELVPQQKKYEYLLDSNLDWGQSLVSFEEYYMIQKPHTLQFSYFGRDDAAWYGFLSEVPWGSYKNDEICAFHPVYNAEYTGVDMTAISVTNWYSCHYYKQPQFTVSRIKHIVADSILIF